MEKGTKHRLLYLYLYLKNNTDTDHPLSTKQLIKMLNDEYGIHVGRNTISNDLAILKSCGMSIDFYDSTQNLYYFDGQTFEVAELKLLIDAVASSKFITQKKSEELIDKILNMTNEYNAVMLRRHVQVSGRVKGDNEKGYYIVDVINTAIDLKRKIRFFYTDFDVNKKRYVTNDGNPYTLSPYTIIWDGDYYYVRGYCDERQEMRNFRIDRIYAAPEILDESGASVPDCYDVGQYQKEVFRMFDSDEPEAVVLECDVSVMKSIIDKFGLDVDTKPLDDKHFLANIRICTSPTFFRWVFGYAGQIRILAPDYVKEEYRKRIERLLIDF